MADLPEPPRQFDGFEVIRPLGRGGMGTVYLGRDTMLDRPLALKFIASASPTTDARERFLLEARAIARLQHPNVVAIYRFGTVGGHPYVAYELVTGRPLHEVECPVEWRSALAVARSAARGLAAVHREGVLHRDIKPANMILLGNGDVKLLDFGIAKLLDRETDSADPFEPTSTGVAPTGGANPQTITGRLAGTPPYMAPELWRYEPASAQTDIYALGLVIYKLVTGSLPWPEMGPAVFEGVLERQVPRLAGQRTDVPAPLLEVIDAMTATAPADRFASADRLSVTLEEIATTYLPFTEASAERGDRDIAALRDSFARVLANTDRFARDFYGRLFAASPEMRDLFSPDMTAQRRKLMTALQLIVKNLRRSEVLVPMLADLGARHVRYGVRPEHFEYIGRALLETLAKHDADAWGEELAYVWSYAYQRLASTMLSALDRERAAAPEAAPSAAAREPWMPPVGTPRVHYARNRSAALAYQQSGSGALPVVVVPGWISHLEHAWHEPTFARFLARLSSRTRLLFFDTRGTGLSDRDLDALSIEDRADDILAVMDGANIERAALVGLGDSAAACALLAATTPERVSGLVAFGGAARIEADPAAIAADCAAIRERWGDPLFLDRFAPSRAGDAGFASWWAGCLRSGCGPSAAEALVRARAALDVRVALPLVSAPTLVLHRRDDRHTPLDLARELAAAIPAASISVLPGADHLPFTENGDEVVDRILEFLLSRSAPIASSTSRPRLASTMTLSGGTDWYRELCRRAIADHGGITIDHGPQITGLFDRVAGAATCGLDCLEHARQTNQTTGVAIDLTSLEPGRGLTPDLVDRSARLAADHLDAVVATASAATLLPGHRRLELVALADDSDAYVVRRRRV